MPRLLVLSALLACASALVAAPLRVQPLSQRLAAPQMGHGGHYVVRVEVEVEQVKESEAEVDTVKEVTTEEGGEEASNDNTNA